MPSPYFEPRDAERAGVRVVCAAMDQAVSHSSLPAAGMNDELRVRWAELVKLLLASHTLEPARQLRNCPVCKRIGMREATRCGHCWTKLLPLDIDYGPA